MNTKVMLSQVLAMIKVSFDTKAIMAQNGDLWFMKPENILLTSSHSFSIKWKRGRVCGSETMSLHFSLEDIRPKYHHAKLPLEESKKEYVFRIYNFNGDNCNDRTQFIYWLMGNQIDIIDDLGICSLYDPKFSKKHLDKINPFDVSKELFNLEYPEQKGE